MYVQFKGTTETTQRSAGLDEPMVKNASAGFYGELIGPNINGIGSDLFYIRCLSLRRGYAGTYTWHEEDFVRLNTDLTRDEVMEYQSEMEEELDERLLNPQPASEGITDESSEVFYQNAIEALKNYSKESSKKPKIDYEKITEELCKISSVPLTQQDYSKPHYDPTDENRREKMQTTGIHLDTGNIIEGKFRRFKTHFVNECCHLFNKYKTSHDIALYIPVDWCNYMGYNEEVIELWLDFIRELRFPFADFAYNWAKPSSHHSTIRMTSGQPYFIKTNLYHNIVIKASEVDKLNYLVFLLIRYLYHSHYNNIPGLCLQIKGQTTLSNWEILMLTHCLYPYEQDYGLFKVNVGDKSVKIPFIGDKENNEKGYFKQLSLKDSINKSFYYVQINPPYYQQLIQIITKKEYIKLKGWIEGIKDNLVGFPKYEEELPIYDKYFAPDPIPGGRGATGFASSRTGIMSPDGTIIWNDLTIETEAPRREPQIGVGIDPAQPRRTRRADNQSIWNGMVVPFPPTQSAQPNQSSEMSEEEIIRRLRSGRAAQPPEPDNQF